MRTLVTFVVFLVLATSALPSSAQSNPDKLTIGTITLSLNNLPIYVGQEKGFFTKENVFVEAVVLNASTRSIPALIGGSTQLSASAAMTTIRAIEKGAALKIVGGLLRFTISSPMPSTRRSRTLKARPSASPA
jgi:ABC-type nitrate/sulfonate/bicarbonate transport system substrate-binding protein